MLTMRMDESWLARGALRRRGACVSKSAHLPSLDTILLEIVNRHVVGALPRTAPLDLLTLTARPAE